MPAEPRTHDTRQSMLRHTPFRRFWLARVFSTIAFQMQAVAFGWQIYAITGSPLYLGLVGLAQFLPMFLLTLAVGHVADRSDRRTVIRVCQAMEGLIAAALALGCLGHWVNREIILIMAFLLGAARAFEYPIMQALAPGLVPVHLFPRAAAFSASASQTAAILGPALGGLLYGLVAGFVYGTAAVLFVAASLFIFLI